MNETIVTRAHNGKTVAIHVGEKLIVRLEESATTGFTWAVANDADMLVVVHSDYAPASAGVGGGGLRTFTFIAKKAGAASLRFKLWREWEGESSVTDVFTVNARIDAK